MAACLLRATRPQRSARRPGADWRAGTAVLSYSPGPAGTDRHRRVSHVSGETYWPIVIFTAQCALYTSPAAAGHQTELACWDQLSQGCQLYCLSWRSTLVLLEHAYRPNAMLHMSRGASNLVLPPLPLPGIIRGGAHLTRGIPASLDRLVTISPLQRGSQYRVQSAGVHTIHSISLYFTPHCGQGGSK